MRGLAAIVVMLGHVSRALDRSGYLAVDFFFLLSSFVIARSYGIRLSTGMSFSTFARLRFVRLYPMFLFGMLIGLSAQLSFPTWYPMTNSQLALTVLFNSFMLPAPGASTVLFPLNTPA